MTYTINMRRTKKQRLLVLASLAERLEAGPADYLTRKEAAAVRWAMAERQRLADWIADHGDRTNTCTRNVLGEVCGSCRCAAVGKAAYPWITHS